MAKDCIHVLAPPNFAFAVQHNDGTISARSNQAETAATTAEATAIPILSAVGASGDRVAASNGDPLITYPLIDAKKQGGAVVGEVMAAISWMARTVDKLGNGATVDVQVSLSATKETATNLVVSETAAADAEHNGDEGGDDDGTDGARNDVSTSSPVTSKAIPKPMFVTRIVRELSFKREVNVQINKMQLEMKKMQLLIGGYQADVQRTLEHLKKEAMQLDEGHSGIKQQMTSNLSRLLADGFSRQLVDTYRSLQLLLLQENKLQRAKVTLRQTILQTRVEECDWMVKSVGERCQQQVQRLLSSQLSGGSSLLDCDQDAVCQTLSPDDPFFATPDQLHTSNAQSKQLDLQLRSIAALIETIRTNVQELIKQTGESDELQSLLSISTPGRAVSATVPSAVKRNSFKSKTPSNSSPLCARQIELRRILGEVSQLIDRHVSSSRIQDDHTLYNEHLDAFARLVSDRRTRAGQLLATFYQKLVDDARVDVEITTTATMAMAQSDLTIDSDDDEKPASEEEETATDVSDAVNENKTTATDSSNYYFSNLNALTKLMQSSECDKPAVSAVIDVNQLPSPVWILAFARFLQKVIASEYALDQPLPLAGAIAVATNQQAVDLEEKPVGNAGEDGDETQSSSAATDNMDSNLDHHVTSERALEACVHHFVFSKLSAFCVAYEQSRFCKDENTLGRDAEAEELPCLQQHHWTHSKQQMQGVSWELLAFPRDVADKIRTHFNSTSSNDQHHQHLDSFLPQALHAFKSIECETTPRGVIRAVMIAFIVLHAELSHLLYDRQDAATTTTSASLSADVLVPSLVLMMSRLNHERELDLLWRRLNLVCVFESTLLSQGCEEAYYLTCLLGAMQVIQTFASSDVSGGGHQISLAATRKSCDDCQKLVAYRHCHVTIKRYRGNDDSRPSCESQNTGVSTKTSVNRKAKTKTLKKLRDAHTNPPPSLNLNDEAVAIENLSKWIASQASIDSARAPTTALVVAAHELWLYEQVDAERSDT